MTFDAAGFKLTSLGGAVGTGSGSVNNKYMYSTNDTDTVVETDGYFDGVLDDGLNVGDHIDCSIDLDGTPERKDYIVTVGGADVTIALTSTT